MPYKGRVTFLADMSVALPSEDSCPKRFGLIYDPPSLILEYRQVSTARLFHRRIGLKHLKPSSDPVHIAESIRRKNRHLLGEDKVFLDQLVSLVMKLQSSLATADAKSHLLETFDYESTDLNKLSKDELDRHKDWMDVQFFKNQVRPGDPGYNYDVQVEFGEARVESGWDSDESVNSNVHSGDDHSSPD